MGFYSLSQDARSKQPRGILLKEIWNNLDLHIQVAIEIAAFIGASSIILVAATKAWRYLSSIIERIKWLMSDENDHAVIMSRLDKISGMLVPNGGTSIADSLNRIEHTVTFLGARQLASLHTNPNPVFETNAKGEVIFVNNSYKKLFGIDAHDAEGMGWVNIIDNKYREDVVTKWFRAVSDKRTFDECIPLVGADGRHMDTHVVAYVIRDDQENMLGHHGEVIPEWI